jgi:hypothetical protein
MARPLDGTALLAYFRQFGFPQKTQELLISIRSSPPNRTPGAHHGNMPVWYPSKKMQCIIKAESAKVEFAFLLAAEHDDAILEIWDQPPAIPLEYCKSFCFVGENWIIRWAVKQAEEVCLAEEMSFLPLCWLFQASEHPPIELSNFRPRSKMIYTHRVATSFQKPLDSRILIP